jgi:RNA polymerase sigma factor (TIGR02999 family)
MSTAPSETTTRLLAQVRAGNRDAFDRLLAIVYAELRKIAAGYLRHERVDHTLQPTALVHEVFLRLAGQPTAQWHNRAHFVGVAAQLMRLVLLDHARARRADKRGGGALKVSLDVALTSARERDIDLLALDEALRRLEGVDARLCRVIELRYFGGLANREIGEALGISRATVDRELAAATAWLRREMGPPAPPDPKAAAARGSGRE